MQYNHPGYDENVSSFVDIIYKHNKVVIICFMEDERRIYILSDTTEYCCQGIMLSKTDEFLIQIKFYEAPK